jgi:hypothetical protein
MTERSTRNQAKATISEPTVVCCQICACCLMVPVVVLVAVAWAFVDKSVPQARFSRLDK